MNRDKALENSIEKVTLDRACSIARKDLFSQMRQGRWTGELSASALSTATAMSALGLYKQNFDSDESKAFPSWIDEQLLASLDWLVDQQNPDGGWGDTDLSHSNIATSFLAVAAIKIVTECDWEGNTESSLANTNNDSQQKLDLVVENAWAYIKSKNTIDGLRERYGKDKTFAVPILANCAMAGIVPWKEVSPLPFELACIPQDFYRFVRMPVVSYAIPALVAIGQAKYLADPPWNPITRITRKLSIARSLDVLNRMQPQSGGYLEAIPLTCFVAMALIHSGRHDHPVVHNALRFIQSSFRDEGSWPIDTNLATWVTTLSINALIPNALEAPHVKSMPLTNGRAVKNNDEDIPTGKATDNEDSILNHCDLDWVLGCQYKTVHPFTGAKPGGWGWSDLSGAVPDADDTPGALLAIRKFFDAAESSTQSVQQAKLLSSATSGCRWLLDLQNRDHGWPTFCKGWGRLPFDRSGADITAHVIRALDTWHADLERGDADARAVAKRIPKAIGSGIAYLLKKQNSDGSWFPLWFGNQDSPKEENPIYGTSKIVTALCEVLHTNTISNEKNSDAEKNKKAYDALSRGLKWIFENQNRDDGWGGGSSIQWSLWAKSDSFPTKHMETTSKIAVRLGHSSIEETSLAVEGLSAANEFICWLKSMAEGDQRLADLAEVKELTQLEPIVNESVTKGIDWLKYAVCGGFHHQSWPIGFYFAKLWYHERLYPLIFAAAALTRASRLNLSFESKENQPERT